MKKLWIILMATVFLAGCGGSPGGNFGPGGATPGGVKDHLLARRLIEQGQVPPPEALFVEASFSEHDLGLQGSECNQALCLAGALDWAPDVEGKAKGWFQVGLASGLKEFVRPPTSLVFTVDVSGSMGYTYGSKESPIPLEVAKDLMGRMVDQLGPDDHVAIVTYASDIREALGVTPASQKDRIMGVVNSLQPGGSTYMEAGLSRGFKIAETLQSKHRRVILFTDENPNVGATQASEFERMVRQASDKGIYLSVMGIGLGLDPNRLAAMTNLKGGNGYSLIDKQDNEKLMADAWPWLAYPIAYNLEIALSPGPGFKTGSGYGFPQGTEPSGLKVSTVFLSKRRGALLVSLEPEQGSGPEKLELSATLRYTPTEGQAVEQTLTLKNSTNSNAKGHGFDQAATAKAVALALLFSNARVAATKYQAAEKPTEKPMAVALLQKALDRYSEDIKEFSDGEGLLERDRIMIAKMLDLMKNNAPIGNLYPKGLALRLRR